MDRLDQISTENKYLTEDQAIYIYKKVELGDLINTSTMEQEIDQDQELNRLYDTSRDINPYRELIVNKAEKKQAILSQMEPWPILSNIQYIQYDRHPKNFYNLNIRVVNKEKYKRNLLQRRKDKC